MLRAAITAMVLAVVPASAMAQAAMESDQLPANYQLSSNPNLTSSLAAAGGGVLGRKSNGGLLGIDSLLNWSSFFYDPGVDSNGFPQFTWQYTMVGRPPFGGDEDDRDHDGRRTNIAAPIVPVNIDLRNFDGSPRFLNGKRMFLDATQYVTPVLNSPVFSNSVYTSSDRPTQFTDAVQRAEFFKQADDDWHTILRPRVLPARTMVLIRGTYQFGANPDGSLRFVLVDEGTFVNALFPPTATDTTTIMGAVENSGEIRTTDLSTFLFPNTFLYVGTPANCCILGFHSYDVEPGNAANKWREKRYVMDYASWISPGLFTGGFEDVTALSHELAETFNDPFVNNFTPWWLAPFGLCQNNLETGDVIEGMANATFPIALNGFTYHPQNEALLPWFAGVSPSPAIGHAYSYPDTTLLTSAAVSQNLNCNPPK
jgi:hypothetical protein